MKFDIRLLAARMRNRGLRNTVRVIYYHSRPLTRYNTFTKTINFVKVKFAKLLRLERVPGMPYRYYIDPANICNLHCLVCPTGLGILGREHGRIAFEQFKSIVDQVMKYAYVLELYNWGEPFLHPRIFDMISYAHTHRISVRLSSNMNYFSREMASQTVLSGLDRIIVSVDGSTQETYERYRRGGDLSRVLNHVRMLVEAKQQHHSSSPFILLRMLVHHYNEHQVDEMRQIAQELGVDGFSTGGFFIDVTDPEQVKEWLPTDEAQSYYDYSAEQIENIWHCAELWEAMVINWDGGVAPCCWIHQKKYDFANAFERSIADIWNDEAYVSSRRVFSRGGAKPGPGKTICAVCQGKPMYLKD